MKGLRILSITLPELIAQLQRELESADAEAAACSAALRTAEIRAAFVRGQLAALSRIAVAEPQPIYSNGSDET